MDGEQRTPNDVTISNIMIMSHLKPENSNSESITSSVASGSSGKVDVLNKSVILQLEINKEIDKLFGPALERTRSGSEIEVTAPLRQRKRQYHSQEVLSPDISLTEIDGTGSSNGSLNILHTQEPKSIDDEKLNRVSILYDNQRAEIVASVTERLYNKLKRNEKVVSKMESMVDKKIMQPLSELKICSNARQRLVELSQKAIKNKRKIGIPAYTQTKKYATRVKDEEVDIQTDLQPFVNHRKNNVFILQKDVSTATETITPRYKDVAAGSKYSTLNVADQYTSTVNKKKTFKNAFTMTNKVTFCDCSTQTYVLPPPRRKKRIIYVPKYLKKSEALRTKTNDKITSPVININISPVYPQDSESSSEQSEVAEQNCTASAADIVKESKGNKNKINDEKLRTSTTNIGVQNKIDDFSEDDGISVLPRIKLDTSRKVNGKDFDDIILGRSGYPYNIVLSPTKDIDETKRVIQFKDIDISPAECGSTKWLEKKQDNFDSWNSKNRCNHFKPSGSVSIDTAELSKKNSLDNIKPYVQTSSSTYRHLYKTNPRRTELIEGTNNNGNTNYIKYSLSESELRLRTIKSDKQSVSENNKLVKFETLYLPTEKQKFSASDMCLPNKYRSHGKLTPTEYLKQLIHIRREAVASNH